MSAKNCLVLFCVGLFSSVAIVDGLLKSFTAERNYVKQGEKIVLTCVADKLDHVSLDVYIKKYVNNKWITIRNPIAEEVFDSRFSFNISDNASISTTIVTINSTVPGDAGNYSCDFRNDTNFVHSYQYITVEVEPVTIRLFLDDHEVSNGTSSQMLKPNAIYKLRCESTGSNPYANISVTYGIATRLNPTNTIYGNAIVRYDQKDPQLEYVVPIEYNTTTEFRFTPDAADMTLLTCVAKVNNDLPGISTSFYAQYEDVAPVFQCNDTMYATNGKSVRISCAVYSTKSNLTKASFFFNTGKSNESINGFPLNEEHSAADRNYHGVVQVVTQVKFVMNLTIDITDTRNKVVFNFEAVNAQGYQIHSVTLLDQGISGKTPSLAPSTKSAATLLVALFVLSAYMICP